MATFEMLWDCPYCGTRKLLGKTHRHCPGCGAPQDPDKRYFPSDDEKVAVEDHEYVGADRICEACEAPMNARAAHCTQCGSPMETAGEVRRLSEARPTLAARPQPGPAPRSGARKLGCLSLVVGLVLLTVTALVWKRDAVASVTGHAWERSISIEVFGPTRDSAWCDSLPGDAYDVSRSREVRDHRQIPDGEDCTTQRIDQGDGTFREERSCTPRYRQEPVYDDKCTFTANRWSQARVEHANGSDLAPVWPEVVVREGECAGCEREGGRSARYRVRFAGADGQHFECSFDDESHWRRFTPGSRWRVSVGVLAGGASCGSLRAGG